MTIATGIAKQVRYKKEVTWGVAPGASGGQVLRRVTSNLDLKKDTFKSNELRQDMQRADFRHGSRSADGTISGELSVGTYSDFLASSVRQAWQTASTTGALVNVTAAVSGSIGTFTRAAGSYLTDGFKIGDVIRWSGWAAPATANNARNFYITSLTATVMTGVFLDGTTPVAKAAGDSVTCIVQGKKTWVPTSGHTNESYSIEHWFSDVAQSELFTGLRVSQVDVKLPATGMATVDVQFMGKDIVTGTAAYFTAPAAASTGTALSAATNGLLYVGGTQIANVTGLEFSIKGNMSTGQVIASNTRPDIFQGPIDVDGQFTAYFQDATLRDLFLNETEATLMCAFAVDTTATASFMAFTMPRIKVGGASKDDGEKGLTLTVPFTALYNINGGTAANGLATTISIQDSSL